VRIPSRLAAIFFTVLAGFATLGLVAAVSPDSSARRQVPAVFCRPAPAPPESSRLGRRLYVAPNGSDSNPGTLKRPFQTLDTALSRLRRGDTLFLRNGTYDGWFTLLQDGTAKQPIVVRSYPGEQAVIRGRLKISANHVVVSQLVFDQSGGDNQDVGIYAFGGKDDWIAYNEVRHAYKSGILVGDGADRLSIVGNWIHDNGQSNKYDHGVYWAGGVGGLLAQNVIDDNAAYGVQLYPNADQIVVRRNTIVHNARSGIIIGGTGSETSDGDLLSQNVVAFNNEQGIRTNWDGQVGVGNLAQDNLSFGNGEGNIGGDGLDVRGTVLDNPAFPSVDGRDYRIGNSALARLYGARLDVHCVGRGLGTADGIPHTQ